MGARTGDGAGPFLLRHVPSRPMAQLVRYHCMNTTPWRVRLFVCLLVGGLLACTLAPAADSERLALGAAIDRWIAAVNARDVATLTSSMTADVELLEGSATATGRDAAIRALGEARARGQLVARTREITIANDVAWHVAGLAQIQKDGVAHSRGQALEIWKRVNGVWKLHRRAVTGVGAAGDLLTRPSTKEPVLDRPGN
jgi:ketosteroid isomerase-like protein